MRRCLVQAVALALVLPALIVLLPQPALSAAATLERDLMLSVCGQDMPQVPDGGPQQHAGHDHCVLCGNHCPNCSPGLASATPAFAGIPRRAPVSETAASRFRAPPLQVLLVASRPRGPPARA